MVPCPLCSLQPATPHEWQCPACQRWWCHGQEIVDRLLTPEQLTQHAQVRLLAACHFLEKAGLRFCVDFGTANAEALARARGYFLRPYPHAWDQYCDPDLADPEMRRYYNEMWRHYEARFQHTRHHTTVKGPLMHDTPDEIRCWGCENALDADERESPYDRDGHLWCDDCYAEEYLFTCSWCGGEGDIQDQHRYLAVFDPAACGLRLPGLYRVDAVPYYAVGMGDGVFRDAVTWLGYLPSFLPTFSGYPAGHLCSRCQRRAVAHVAHATDCGILAAMSPR